MIGIKYGWYCFIHRMAGGDLLKFDAITKLKVNECFNWLSFTKDIELEEARINKN